MSQPQHRRRVLVGLLLAGGCTPAEDSGDSADSGGDEAAEDGLAWDFPSPNLVGVEPVPVHRPWPGRGQVAAFDGSQYLVVWEDYRVGGRPIVYGARVTADGTTLDPFGFRILDVLPADSYYQEYKPAVAFDGTNFLIVVEIAGQIGGVRVSPAGTVLDPGGFAIVDPVSPSRPLLVFDGEHYVVVWSQLNPHPDAGTFRARVKPDGTVLDPDGVFVHYQTSEQPVGISFDGTNYLLSWQVVDLQATTTVLDARRMAVDGTLLDETAIRVSPEGMNVSAAEAGFDGTNHVIAWFETGGIWASRVTPEGTLLDPNGLAVTELVEGVSSLDMAAGSGRSILVWTKTVPGEYVGTMAEPVRAAQIAIDGTVSSYPDDSFPLGLEATVTVHPDGALLLWHEAMGRSAEDFPILGTRLDAAGLPVADSVVAPSLPASHQEVRAVAFDGQNFFVAWTDTREPTGEGEALFGARVGADGTPLDPESLQFTAEPVQSVGVVFDGANFVVTWINAITEPGVDRPFNTMRVSPAGNQLDATPLQPPLCGGEVGGASDGTRTLLVGRKCNESGNLSAVRLDQNGAVVGDVITLEGDDPAVVSFDGVGYLVVWQGPTGLSGQRISKAGTLEGQAFSIVEGDAFQHQAIAAGGGHHLVVWKNDSGAWATRVSPAGQVLDPGGRLVVAPESIACDWDGLTLGNCTSVAFDGKDFVIAWRAPAIPGDSGSLDLFAAKLSLEGELSDPFAISQEPEREGPPSLASGDGRVLAAYSRFVPGPPHDARRAVVSVLEPSW